MTATLLFLLIITGAFAVVAVCRYRDAEKQIRILKSLIPNDKKSDFEVHKHVNAEDGRVTQCTITIYTRRGLPIISDLTGIPLNRLADQFDEDERNGEPCIIQTREFKG